MSRELGRPSGRRLGGGGSVVRPRPPALASLLVALALLCTCSSPASAQLASPCELACGVVLGSTGFAFATGTLVAFGRKSGGLSNAAEVAAVWGGSVVLFVGAGLALGENGGRQERAVYAAGVGTLAGSLLGLGVESVLGGGDGARKVGASLIGAALGALAGGVYGALTWDVGRAVDPTPLFQLRLAH